MSVISLRELEMFDRKRESAAGLIDSRRCSETVTRETLTGAETPAEGRISTRPSIRGRVADMPG